jgi:uncharacterized protein (DUF697 family)
MLDEMGKKLVKATSQKIKKSIMTTEKENSQKVKHADTVIRNHVIWSMGAGLIPVLIADIFAVSALQLDMIRQLCRVYEVDFSETQGKALVTSLTSSTIARVSAGSVVKLIPGVGSLIGGATVSVFAGASTYALGEVFKRHFETGGTILDFDPSRLKKLYKEKFEKGKRVAQDLRKDKSAQKAAEKEAEAIEKKNTKTAKKSAEEEKAAHGKEILDRLKELAKLKEDGVLSEEEFNAMKDKLIQQF